MTAPVGDKLQLQRAFHGLDPLFYPALRESEK